MTAPLFSRRVRLFGNVAIAVLFVIFFLLPFAFRGARLAVEGIRNDVKEWLPSDFEETSELDWFREHFLTEQFIVVSWPGCNTDDPRLQQLYKKIKAETIPNSELPQQFADQEAIEALRDDGQTTDEQNARKRGDAYGLNHPGDPTFFENRAGLGEKWLRGHDDRWFYITPDGELVRWQGRDDAVSAAWRELQFEMDGKIPADGKQIARFGSPAAPGKPNAFHQDPSKLFGRFFKTVETGPQVVAKLSGKDGALHRGNDDMADEDARRLAYSRLDGILFGPHPPTEFVWTGASFRESLPDYKRKQIDAARGDGWQASLDQFISELVADQYDGDKQALLNASNDKRAEHWDTLFDHLDVPPMGRQTCLLLTLSDVGRHDLGRVVGRPVLGNSRGRLLDLAIAECGISKDELRLGGPPIDNVAIDQEASVTLVRLIFWSGLVGMGLAYICFRSFKVTLTVFFVGGVSAAASLGIVHWWGSVPDAILMTMPSLVYVLGLSGAVHIVNYYRDAVQEDGVDGAAETAVSHGWFPCTLAAFTTALGLISLCVSNLIPIQKFGFFSALGVMATVVLLFSFLPSALTIWAPGYKRRDQEDCAKSQGSQFISKIWRRIGLWVVKRHALVTCVCLGMLILFALGLPRIQTSVQLLKLFHEDARIIKDYEWLEANLAKLVPLELIVRVDSGSLEPATRGEDDGEGENEQPSPRESNPLMYSFLERAEAPGRIHKFVEDSFGEKGQGVMGRGTSVATLVPPFPTPKGGSLFNERMTFASALEGARPELLESDFLRVDNKDQSELWRISLRLGALNDVDYGTFVDDLKLAVEPALSAHRYRNQVFRKLAEQPDANGDGRTEILVLLGPEAAGKQAKPAEPAEEVGEGGQDQPKINQTGIFIETIWELFANRGFRVPKPNGREHKKELRWHLPDGLMGSKQVKTDEEWQEYLAGFDCVVLASDDAAYSRDVIDKHAAIFVDARDYVFRLGESETAAERRRGGDPDATIDVVYTGLVPIVYKAQHTLLQSLIESVCLAFAMIAVVMMILLRDWKRPPGLKNSLNVRAGMISMLPNVFPVVLIFGAMGHLGRAVDIGTMMTASVAIGVAVDDTIHFLNWFRHGMRLGLSRRESIGMAYDRCATAMTQTTLIGGFGLAVFGFSTFTPTQQFGIMMLVLLQTALIGDLIFLPALLAGPLGRYFEVAKKKIDPAPKEPSAMEEELADASPNGMSKKPRSHLQSPKTTEGAPMGSADS